MTTPESGATPTPCVSRRRFLQVGATTGLTLGGLGGADASTAATAGVVSASTARGVIQPPAEGELGIPGPYPGRVVEVRNPAMSVHRVKNRAAIETTLDRAMTELTGADSAIEAWRVFFEPGDVVGVKMNPVGNPLANSSSELMLAVIDRLKAVGIKPSDIVVFERYKNEFINARMHEAVPDGITWGGLTPADDPSQLEIDFKDDLWGYDPDEFVEMDIVHQGFDPKDDRTRRSHLGKLITRRVNKLVLLPVLKDHGSAGVTGALKNMSHGLVNNVARSHSTPQTNVCNYFIPSVVRHPVIRRKCVLQIMDGIIGVYQGGPFAHAENIRWTWEANTLFVATDPVALDMVEWMRIDAKRKEMGLAPVGAVGRLALDADREGFDIRQPQHIILAGNLGLGRFEFKSPRGRRSSIDHRIVTLDPAA